ncbi:MAG: aspartyl-phosphate phosphatase Spo0E family protein [Bacillota bacterium]|nr:aspartyl-phosphate phosphatase Spo0E family protein [Bacillota bacterium]
MSYAIEDLCMSIEEMRKELYALSKNKDLTDPEVVLKSQRLDLLLNEYECQMKAHIKN